MKNWSFGKKFLFLMIIGFIVLFAYRKMTSFSEEQEQMAATFSQNKILQLEVNGVIFNGKKFLKNLKKYKKDKTIKAVVIDINSPGGAVGPSQEMYYEIVRAKNETKKPFICVTTGLMASGGYYTALACDKIVVAPGAMIGSIGVIMEFANLEKLYDWAKIQRYTITSGKYKDSGSEYRAMRDDERQLFQDMIDEVYQQFKSTVMSARGLSEQVVSQYADGRVMTGATAVKYKFADQEGTFEDAVRLAAQLSGLGDDYHVVKPSKDKENWWEMVLDREEEDSLNSTESRHAGSLFSANTWVKAVLNYSLNTELLNKPLYLLPGSF